MLQRFYEKFALGKCFNEREESEEEREKRRKNYYTWEE
ncbi:hypothetical protein HSIEG1_559 [Enterococcus sp. HSIEG1]|nr:hypothetical protein HSIEG1_559 [Enterococcus sp. HSIEG1]